MKLWLLRPIDGPKDYDHWRPWHDKAFGFVVRAETEEAARILANSEAGDENRGNKLPWLDRSYSTCDELSADGSAEIVIRDFAAA